MNNKKLSISLFHLQNQIFALSKQLISYVKQMNGARTTRTTSTKPVNINISFTINPKNILNQQSFPLDNHMKNKKISGVLQANSQQKQIQSIKPRTPDLVSTQRVDINKQFGQRAEDKKEKKSRKRNSVDESYLYEYNRKSQGQKSINVIRQGDSLHIRKSSTKSKKQSETSAKRKHNKTFSKVSAIENNGFKNNFIGNSGPFNDQRQKNLKSIINRIITNQLSKKSLPLQLPTQQNKTARKKKANRKKQLKQGKSQYLIRRYENQNNDDALNRKMLIQKLTSIRSINNSIFKSQEDEESKPRQRRTIVINTDQSIDCIEQIHEIERAAKKTKNEYRDSFSQRDRFRATETISLIDHFVSLLRQNSHIYNNQIEITQNTEENKIQNSNLYEMPIQQEFQHYRRHNNNHDSIHRNNHQIEKSLRQQPRLQHKNVNPTHKIQRDTPTMQGKRQKVQQKRNEQKIKSHQIQINHLRPFCSSQMTKQQKMINQIQRVKLNQLKKHEVQKWAQLLSFIKTSMSEGKANHDQILKNIYSFLQQTKLDLQNQISKPQSEPKDVLQEFTNKFSSNQMAKSPKQQIQQPQQQIKNQKSFNEISSMSYKDEDYQEQNQQLKMMNLQMIQNALKARHENLLEKRNREIFSLQQLKNNGKLTQTQFISQKQKIEKWTKKQTSEIMQARKNIWKGYNEAKGIIQKSLKSKHFQQQSSKKKNMMKCLSENYLLKNYNYKRLLKQEEEEQSQQSQQHEQQHKQVRQNEKNVVKKAENLKKDKQQQKSQQSNQQQFEQSNNFSHQDSQHFYHSERSQSPTNLQKNAQLKQSDVSLSQLKKLHEEQDMNILKQKLLDIKQKHLQQDDNQQLSSQKIQRSQEVSYEQVDNELQQSLSENEMKIINLELGKQSKLPSPYPDVDDRLKHILPQDKQDIFQFIFLDLSIQLYQQPCHENKIMDAINKYVSYMKRQASKKKGVKTNLNVVKEYLKRFLGFVLRTHKNVLKTLDQPVGPTAIQMLRYMHENDDDPIEGEQNPSPLVIPTTVFDAFQKSLIPSIQFEVYYQHDEERQAKRIQFLKNIIHIHNKALFDAMNEYLDLLRPFGIWGKPFPWKHTSSFERVGTEQAKQEKLKKASQKVVEYCSYVCGLLVDKQQSLVGNARLSQEYIQQIKQDRLSRMLATQLMQNQERWLFYDDEETQVLVQIANTIYNMMVRQATHQISQLQKNKKFVTD